MGPTKEGLRQFGPRGGPYVGHPGHLGLAAINFAKAAAWFPIDEPDRIDSLWYAMLAMLNRGAFYVADLHALFTIACHSQPNICQYLDNSAAFHPGKELADGIRVMVEDTEPNRVATPMLVWESAKKESKAPRDDEWKGMNEWLEFVFTGGDKEKGFGIPLVASVIRDVEEERKGMEDAERVGDAWSMLDEEVRRTYPILLFIDILLTGKTYHYSSNRSTRKRRRKRNSVQRRPLAPKTPKVKVVPEQD